MSVIPQKKRGTMDILKIHRFMILSPKNSELVTLKFLDTYSMYVGFKTPQNHWFKL